MTGLEGIEEEETEAGEVWGEDTAEEEIEELVKRLKFAVVVWDKADEIVVVVEEEEIEGRGWGLIEEDKGREEDKAGIVLWGGERSELKQKSFAKEKEVQAGVNMPPFIKNETKILM